MSRVVVRLRPGSDGDATQVPPQGIHTQVNPPLLYLEKIGQQWMESRGEARPGIKYVLEHLPIGYTMWQRPRPSDSRLVDKYLWGHPSGKKFDSPNRFYPHFEYLMDNNGDSMGCPCTVCSGSAGVLPSSSSSSSRLQSAGSSRPATPKELSTLSKFKLPQQQISRVPRVVPATVSVSLKGRSKLGTGMDTSHVDEEGTPDVYRNLIDRLRRHGTIDEAIEEPLSPDWRAEQECLPTLLNNVQEQELWVPRTGDIVLYVRDLPKDVDFFCDEVTGEWQLYDKRLETFLGPPQWEAGLVGQPTANTPSITDLIENTEQENITYSGVRVEPIPDPNDNDKSISKKYKYVSLRQTRPFVLWRDLLHGIPQKDWHPTITNTLTLTSTVSLMGKHRFCGTWPTSKIYCYGLYLGFEMLAVGDTIRILPTAKSLQSTCTEIMVIKSIRLVWSDLDKASANDYDDGEPYKSKIWIYGSAYTTDPSRSDKQWLSCDAQVPKAAGDYSSDWYPLHPPSKELAVPYSRILSRLYERKAMAYFHNSGSEELPNLDVGRQAVLEAREYACRHDKRIVQQANATWYWGDDRADSLNLHTINGLDIAKYDQERNIKEWRKNIKLIDAMATAKTPAHAESSKTAFGSSKNVRQFPEPETSSLPLRMQGSSEPSSSSPSSEDRLGNPNYKKRGHVLNLGDSENESDDEVIRKSTKIIHEEPSLNKKKTRVEVVIH